MFGFTENTPLPVVQEWARTYLPQTLGFDRVVEGLTSRVGGWMASKFCLDFFPPYEVVFVSCRDGSDFWNLYYLFLHHNKNNPEKPIAFEFTVGQPCHFMFRDEASLIAAATIMKELVREWSRETMNAGMNTHPAVEWCYCNLPGLGFYLPHLDPLEWRKNTWTIVINPQTGLCTFSTIDYRMFLDLCAWMMANRIEADHTRATTATVEIMFDDTNRFQAVCTALPN